VSSTLFNVGVLAEMSVESRTNHSRPVAYLPAGRDATVEYGAIDLRLRNATSSPQLLWTEVGPRSLTITVFGVRRPGRDVAIVVSDQMVVPAPGHTVIRRDRDLPQGEMRIEPARPGLRARTLRLVRQDGIVVRQEVVANSYYRPAPRTVIVGTGAAPLRVSQQVQQVHAP
jgi:vancomycin resistance protein YoaR